MKLAFLAVMGAIAVANTGCSGAYRYRGVNLYQDLDRDTLSRYEREWDAVRTEHPGDSVTRLEHTNLWPLGLLAYWRRGTVLRTGGESAAAGYNVSSTLGLGPLSVIYVGQTHAMFRGDGTRVSTMTMRSVLWGHLAMFHTSDSVLAGGRAQTTWSAHLLHHIVNLHRMNGHTSVSLLSMPNLLGAEGCSRHPAVGEEGTHSAQRGQESDGPGNPSSPSSGNAHERHGQ